MEHKNVIPLDVQALIAEGVKCLEIQDTAVANAVVALGQYRIERFSDRRDAYVLLRREK